MLNYPSYRYDDNFVLKVPLLLWLTLLYGVRHVFIVSATRMMPLDVFDTPWIYMQSSALFLLTDAVAALLLFATGHRVPTGSNFMRQVWKLGRWLLAGAFGAAIALFVYLNRETITDPGDMHFLEAILVVAVDLAFIAYLLGSRLVTDVFRDFPAPAPKP